MATQRVLVVDDDATVRDVVVRYLERAGYQVDQAADGPSALASAAGTAADLVVLDLMLPGMSGLEVCRRLRATTPVPVIMLTALGEESDRIMGLEVGADDYVTKPFSPRELLLRVQSVLRRVNATTTLPALLPFIAPAGQALVDGDLVVDLAAHEARLGGRPLALTSREYDLLVFLMHHPRQAFSRSDLLDRVWGWSFGDHSTVTVHVRRLREKVEADPAAPRRIQTVWGTGYRFQPLAADVSEPA